MKKMISLLMAMLLCFAVSAGIAEEAVTDVFGTQDGAKYENQVAGLGCVLDGWNYRSQEEILAMYNLMKDYSPEEVASLLEKNTSVIVMYAEAADQKKNVNLVLDSAAAEYVKAMGEEAYFNMLVEMYKQVAPGYGWDGFECEIVQQELAGNTYSGIRTSYTYSGIPVYQLQTAYLNGDYMVIITTTSYYEDQCEGIFEYFYQLDQ